MSRIYGPRHRALQDRFDMRRLADGIEQRNVRSEISPQHKEFIESRDMFWLATVDHEGRPTVSYKGGDPGFVRVLDPRTIAFPCYDGNGMFYSMGNLMGNSKVGMLFVSFARPHRLRVQGLASVRDDDPLLAEFFEAQMIVRVSVTEIFRNCPRYVHRYDKLEASQFVPRTAKQTPLAGWKRVDSVQAELAAKDQGRAAREGGTCTREEYERYIEDVCRSDG
jgi:uncharacterized protein